MKKLTVLFLGLALAVTACNKDDAHKTADDKASAKPATEAKAEGKPADKAVVAPTPAPAADKLAALDLTPGGDEWKGWNLQAPEGATVKKGPLAATVTKGDASNFQIEVNNSKVDIAARKKEIQANDVNKLKAFTTDTPDALVYSSSVGMGDEWHFVGNVKVGDKEFYCEDVKGPTYKQDDVAAMWKACQSLAAAK